MQGFCQVDACPLVGTTHGVGLTVARLAAVTVGFGAASSGFRRAFTMQLTRLGCCAVLARRHDAGPILVRRAFAQLYALGYVLASICLVTRGTPANRDKQNHPAQAFGRVDVEVPHHE